MTEEKKAEKLFRQYKTKLLKVLGRKATYDSDLTRVGTQLFGSKYLGTFPQDKAPLGRTGMAIINTDVSKGPGIHWVALYLTPKTVYVYDSFARPTSQLLKILTKNAKGKKIKMIESDRSDAEQKKTSEVCGVLCLSWLAVIRDLGVRKALLI